MNIIYYCFAGAHASVVAAAIHCRRLPADRVPSYDEFIALPQYDRTPPRLIGSPYLMGEDENGHSVYFIGLRDQRTPLVVSATALLTAAGVADDAYLFADAFPLINFSTKLGGLLSKRYSLTGFGRRITVWGMRRQYPSFVALVAGVKDRLARVGPM